MKFLNKHINREAVTDKAACGMAKGILKSQNGFANYMQSLSKNWKDKQQWIFLYSVCLIFGGLSIVAILLPFSMKDTNSHFLPKSIAVPKSIPQQRKGFAITENEIQQVQQYKSKHPNLQQERPGLFDSLTLIEEAYYSQKK